MLKGNVRDNPIYHGHGAWLNKEGCLYDGEWAEGEWHGCGVQRNADGFVFVGQFEHDEMVDGLCMLPGFTGMTIVTLGEPDGSFVPPA